MVTALRAAGIDAYQAPWAWPLLTLALNPLPRLTLTLALARTFAPTCSKTLEVR